MQFVPLAHITLGPDRYRQDFNETALKELQDSIVRVGLLHPIVVRLQLVDNVRKYFLVAGERRMRALQQLHTERKEIPVAFEGSPFKVIPWGYAPVTIINEFGERAEREMELDENLRRSDLTWQEVARATKLLHTLRTDEDPSWTIRQTAKEMAERTDTFENTTRTKQRIALAEHLEDIPGLNKATSEREAYKILANTLENELRAHLSAHQVKLQDERFVMHACDFAEGMRGLEPETIDVILTDPPYGVGADTFGVESVVKTHNYKDTKEHAFEQIETMLRLSKMVCKPKSHLYMFCDFEYFMELREMAETFGWSVWPRPLIWAKNTGYTPVADLGPRYHYECILYAHRGKRNVLLVLPDVLVYPSVPPNNRSHAAQKPAGLFRDLMRRSALPGDLVLDPFCGCGPVFRAARTEQVRAIGFDLDPANIQLCEELLEQDL